MHLRERPGHACMSLGRGRFEIYISNILDLVFHLLTGSSYFKHLAWVLVQRTGFTRVT